MTQRRDFVRRIAAGLGLVCAPMVLSGSAGASVAPPEAFDVTLLRADAIIAATVARVDDAADDPDAADVSFTDQQTIVNRWGKDGAPIPRIRVVGRTGTKNAVTVRNSSNEFRTGERYFLFLQGGSWKTSPLARVPLPLFHVDNGVVKCPDGGGVYGVGAGGPVCSTPEQEAGAPLLETEFSDELHRAVVRAEARRPATAARLAAAARPLETARASVPHGHGVTP